MLASSYEDAFWSELLTMTCASVSSINEAPRDLLVTRKSCMCTV